jgi:uncharacterized protein with PQ loop repeat
MLEVISELHVRDETTPEIAFYQQKTQLKPSRDASITGNISRSLRQSFSKTTEDEKHGLLLQQQKQNVPFEMQPEIGERPAEHWFRQQWNYYWSCLNVVFMIKAACMMSNVVFQLSPYPTVKKIRSDKDTGDFDAAPLVSIAFSCVQWSFYGTFAWIVTGKNGFLVVVYANCFGAFVGLFYVLSYQTYCQCPKARSKLFQYYQMVGNLIIVQVCAIFTLTVERALLFCGAVASLTTIMSACAPWTTVPTTIATRSSHKMPIPLLGASLVSSGLWLICGLILWDVWIMVPNFVGILSNVVLVGIALKYQDAQLEKSQLKEAGACKAKPKEDVLKIDVFAATMDEKLPLWQHDNALQQKSSGCSGGTF